jgi:hypothetical protein
MKLTNWRYNFHGLKRAGGLQLGVTVGYPLNVDGYYLWSFALHLIIVTLRVSLKGKRVHHEKKMQSLRGADTRLGRQNRNVRRDLQSRDQERPVSL